MNGDSGEKTQGRQQRTRLVEKGSQGRCLVGRLKQRGEGRALESPCKDKSSV